MSKIIFFAVMAIFLVVYLRTARRVYEWEARRGNSEMWTLVYIVVGGLFWFVVAVWSIALILYLLPEGWVQ